MKIKMIVWIKVEISSAKLINNNQIIGLRYTYIVPQIPLWHELIKDKGNNKVETINTYSILNYGTQAILYLKTFRNQKHE